VTVGDLVRRWWPLAVEAVAVVVMAVTGVVPTWAGLVHLVGMPPVDLAGDLRILVAEAASYPAFLIGMGISLAARTLVTGSLLATLGVVPTFGAGMARAAALYAVAAVPLAAAAAAEFAGLAAVYAWYAWAGLALTVIVVVVVSPRLIPRGARFRRIPAVLGYLLLLTVVGALADLAGPIGAVAGVMVSAALTAVALERLVRPPPSRLRAAPAAAAIVAMLWAVSVPTPRPAQVSAGAVVLIVPGVDTGSGLGAAYRLDPTSIGFECDRVFYFSYRGPGDGTPPGEATCPIRLHRPYAQAVTQRPLSELVQAMVEQVEEIRRELPGVPLVLLTHSQGAVIAWRAVASGAVGEVSHLVALAGFPHSPVGYPLPGQNGPGTVGADALRVMSWLSRFLGIGSFDPDSALAREILARPNGLEAVFSQRLPTDVTAAMLFSTSDLVVAPEGHDLPSAPTVMVDATHVSMPESDAAETAIRTILEGRSPAGLTFASALLGPALPAWVPPPTDA
jgi:hypothetical protein